MTEERAAMLIEANFRGAKVRLETKQQREEAHEKRVVQEEAEGEPPMVKLLDFGVAQAARGIVSKA